jgi:tRNA A-37 threonylcarbamoyl transferase component Bud32
MFNYEQQVTQKNNASLLASFGLDKQELSLDDGSVLTSLVVVRHVPSRRCVCRAMWQGQPVYVKLFFGNKAAHYALRDVRGVGYLQSAGILTPKILHRCEVKKVGGYAVVFEEISSSRNAEDVWINSSESARMELAKQLIRTVATHHEAGLVQTDLYLKNFLVKNDTVYSIDGDGIRSMGALSQRKSLDNICQLLSKFDVLILDSHLSTLLDVYVEARAWQGSPNFTDVKLRVEAARRKATVSYADKKVFRQCTDVDVFRAHHAFVAIRSNYSMSGLPQTAAELDAYFKPENIIKNGNTCTVALVSMGGLQVVIKRYNIKSYWHGLGRAFRQTRASVSWANAHRLKLLALETANPVALIEKRQFGLKGKAYFLMEYIDAPDMIAFFKQSPNKALRAQAVKRLVQLFYELYLLKISHGDMKATNIKVLEDGRPLLIDLDSMQQHRVDFFAKKAHVRDIKRFMQNWKDEPSLYNAFVKVFKVVYSDHAPLLEAQILE